jgi:hypothetical protein
LEDKNGREKLADEIGDRIGENFSPNWRFSEHLIKIRERFSSILIISSIFSGIGDMITVIIRLASKVELTGYSPVRGHNRF